MADGGAIDTRTAPGRLVRLEHILSALEELGGVAHRDVIVQRVQRVLQSGPRERGLVSKEVADTLAACDRAGGDDARPVRRVFGPSSNRWSLATRAPVSLERLHT